MAAFLGDGAAHWLSTRETQSILDFDLDEDDSS